MKTIIKLEKYSLYKVAAKLLLLLSILPMSYFSQAAEYKVDIEGQHAAVNFKIQHLGISWITGRFDKFNGKFSYDKNKPNKSKIYIEIDTTSVNTNHSLRDKHIRDPKLLNASKYPQATFNSTSYKENKDGSGVLIGKFKLNGTSRTITIHTKKIGEGKDPWGGYRVGFEGKTSFKLKDFNINRNLGPASQEVFLELHIEGVKL